MTNYLVNMNDFADPALYRIACAYARSDNLLFQERIYREDAPVILHESLAKIVMQAAEYLSGQKLRLVLYDGLRTVEAQKKMLETAVVKANPRWLQPPRLLSPPGAGAHPRAMAIDMTLETQEGVLLDMGTPFDFLAQDAGPEHNPAHRDYKHAKVVLHNRTLLDTAMLQAASALQTPLYLLPQEWWDYRLPASVYEAYTPLSEADLPPAMRLVASSPI